MATIDAAQLAARLRNVRQSADRFREIRQEWDLRPGEAETKAQNMALDPLHVWLRTGVDSPEVVIRAVQVLMADPERPAIHKRPAVNYVFKQIAQAWESAGLKELDVLILRGMLLATWPQDLGDGGFALAPLLDSAWMGIRGRVDTEKHLQEWRRKLVTAKQPSFPSVPNPKEKPGAAKRTKDLAEVQAPSAEDKLAKLKAHIHNYGDQPGTRSLEVLREHQQVLSVFAQQLNTTKNVLDQFDTDITALAEQVTATSNSVHELSERLTHSAQLDLLWWGQARYSSITLLPYRRISDATERLWWMAWESSELAMPLEVEPAACFLIETLYQLDKRANAPKRPLKEWLAELIEALGRIHGSSQQHVEAMTMSDHLKKLAGQDPLGLPVTWARLQAANPKPFEGSLEERIRTDIAVDPDTLLDLGDWAAWVFRETMLDRHLEEFGEQ